MSGSTKWSFLVIAFITAFVMFYNLGGIPLLDPDEPVYAETAKEMINFNEYISPRIYGDYWYDKPPMYYWLVVGAFKLFGVNEFAARFPSALLALVCVLYTYFAVSRLFNQRTGMISALVLATSLEFFYLGKAAVTDMTLVFFLTVSLLSFLGKRYYLFYIGAALATVTKGPIGLIFPGAIVFIDLLATRSFSQLKNMKIPAGIIIYLIIAMPWYYLMYRIHGGPFIETFLGFHNLTRFTSPEHPEGVLWYYFIPVLIAGFLPWTAVMVQAVWKALTDGREDRGKLLFLFIWAAFIFVFFSISRTKLVSYILPMYPPLAIIVGWYINRLAENRQPSRPFTWPIVLSVLSVLLCAGLYYGVKKMPDLMAGATATGVLFVVMSLGVWYFIWQSKIDRAFWLKVFSMSLFSVVLMTMLFPQVAPAFHSRDIAAVFSEKYDGVSPVYIDKFLRPGFCFYTDVYGRELKDSDVPAIFRDGQRTYFVIRKSEYKSLTNEQKKRLTTLAVTDEKMLLLKQ